MALSLSAVACHGQAAGSTGYVPTTATGLSVPSGDAGIDNAAKGSITSTCGDRVHIVLAGFIDCRFKEKGYAGILKIYNHTKGLVGISPSSGTTKTKFTITGLVVGRGSFLVKDHRGNDLKVRVRVTL
jgi:hypothetical protein